MQYNDAVMSPIAHRRLAVAALLLVPLAAYANAIRGDFQFDDVPTILENPHYADWRTWFGHLDHIIRPLSSLTFAVDRHVYGTSSAGYHVLNLLLHLGCGLLLYRIVSHAVPAAGSSVPLASSLLFLIHPLGTETVTYISGRATGLMAFWYLAALCVYTTPLNASRSGPRTRLYQWAALLCFALALASKETAMTFPLALLLWDGVIRRRDAGGLRRVLVTSHAPFWLVSLAFAAWTWWHPRYSALAAFSLDIRPLGVNWLSELHATVYGLGLFFNPLNQNFDHDLPEIHSLLQWPLPFDLLVLSGLAAAGLVMRQRLPLASFGIGWFVLQLVPTSLIPRNDLLSERNLYLASIGLCIAAVVLTAQLVVRLSAYRRPALVRITATCSALAIAGTFMTMTVARNDLYRDQVSLWSDTVKKSPYKARPHNNLGHAYATRDEWDRAIDEFRVAAQLDPHYALAVQNLRDAYLHRVGRR